eukprot:365983-Chlamydomonas_euryale.AAC.13
MLVGPACRARSSASMPHLLLLHRHGHACRLGRLRVHDRAAVDAAAAVASAASRGPPGECTHTAKTSSLLHCSSARTPAATAERRNRCRLRCCHATEYATAAGGGRSHGRMQIRARLCPHRSFCRRCSSGAPHTPSAGHTRNQTLFAGLVRSLDQPVAALWAAASHGRPRALPVCFPPPRSAAPADLPPPQPARPPAFRPLCPTPFVSRRGPFADGAWLAMGTRRGAADGAQVPT